MKNNLHFIALACSMAFTNLAIGQVSLTASLAPVPGTDAYVTKPLTNNNFVFAKSGTNLSWDFTTLAAGTGSDTTFFLKPSSASGGASFPSAFAGIKKSGKADVSFANLTNSNVTLVGVYTTLSSKNIILKAVPPIVQFTFPYTYGSAINSSGYVQYIGTGAEFGYPVDSVKYKHTIYENTKVTGYGVLKTPAGSFDGTILEKKIEVSIDSTFIKSATSTGGQWMLSGSPTTSTDSSYNFYNGTSLVQAATVEYFGGTGAISGIRYLTAKIKSTPTGLKTFEVNAVNAVYPMPFSQTATFQFADAAKGATGYTLNIYEISGKLVDQVQTITGSSYTYKNTLLSKGVYFYKLTDGNALAGQGKLIVE
jgi:hypothetical protein